MEPHTNETPQIAAAPVGANGQQGASVEGSHESEPMRRVGTGDLVGLGYRGSDGAVTCCLCDCEMEWRDCDCCCGDGYLDGYEDDPINYAPGEDVPCHMCGGNGGEHICTTKGCKTVVCVRVLSKPNTKVRDAQPPEAQGGAFLTQPPKEKF